MLLEEVMKDSLDTIRGQKVFLTGGTGFFGKTFLDAVIKQNHINDFDITILSRNPEVFLEHHKQYKTSCFKYVKGEIETFSFPNEKFENILHFATPADSKMNQEQPIKMLNTIIFGMSHLLKFAEHANIRKMLFSSSGAVYGDQPADLKAVPETYLGSPSPTAKGSAYGEGKRVAELMGCEHSRVHGYEFKIARCFAFVGPQLNQTAGYAIGNFINDTLNNKDIEIKGNGTPFRSYLYSDDLIVWLLKILKDGKNCEAYNVGSDVEINILDLARKVQKVLKSDKKIKVLKKLEPGEKILRYVPNVDKAKKELALEIWTSLEESITLSAGR